MKKMIGLVIMSLFFVGITQNYAQQKSLQCGQWRGDVKTLTDKEGAALLKAKPVEKELGMILDAKAPGMLDEKSETDKTQPRFPSEKEVVEFTAFITTITITDSDHDFRMVLKSPGSDATFLGELPNPDCATFDKFPAQRNLFRKTWKELSVIMDKISKDSKPLKVKITGVLFWDAPRGERGASSSGLEIHPVLSVTVLPD